jgi:hypothetical protein
MPPTVYIETTVVSYLTAWPSRDLVRAAHQQITREWWAAQRQRFELYTSEVVRIEAAAGDATAAAERLVALDPLPLLDVTPAATALAGALIAEQAFPPNEARDALHVAVATVHGMDYLLTWNFKHIANAQMQDRIVEVCQRHGYRPPVICSPEALSEPSP